MDIDALRAEVAKRHNVLLGKDDPIFVTLTLNELVLADFLASAQRIIDEAMNQSSALATQQEAAAKAVAEKLVTGAGRFIADQVKEAGTKVQDEWARTLEKRITAAVEAATDAVRAKRVALVGAGVSAGLALLTLGLMFGRLLAGH